MCRPRLPAFRRRHSLPQASEASTATVIMATEINNKVLDAAVSTTRCSKSPEAAARHPTVVPVWSTADATRSRQNSRTDWLAERDSDEAHRRAAACACKWCDGRVSRSSVNRRQAGTPSHEQRHGFPARLTTADLRSANEPLPCHDSADASIDRFVSRLLAKFSSCSRDSDSDAVTAPISLCATSSTRSDVRRSIDRTGSRRIPTRRARKISSRSRLTSELQLCFRVSSEGPRLRLPLMSRTKTDDDDDDDDDDDIACVASPDWVATNGDETSVVENRKEPTVVSLSHAVRKDRSRLLARCRSRVPRKTSSSTSLMRLSSARSTSTARAPYSASRPSRFPAKSSTLRETPARSERLRNPQRDPSALRETPERAARSRHAQGDSGERSVVDRRDSVAREVGGYRRRPHARCEQVRAEADQSVSGRVQRPQSNQTNQERNVDESIVANGQELEARRYGGRGKCPK